MDWNEDGTGAETISPQHIVGQLQLGRELGSPADKLQWAFQVRFLTGSLESSTNK